MRPATQECEVEALARCDEWVRVSGVGGLRLPPTHPRGRLVVAVTYCLSKTRISSLFSPFARVWWDVAVSFFPSFETVRVV